LLQLLGYQQQRLGCCSHSGSCSVSSTFLMQHSRLLFINRNSWISCLSMLLLQLLLLKLVAVRQLLCFQLVAAAQLSTSLPLACSSCLKQQAVLCKCRCLRA
jgi:hypothetical protein